MSRRKTIILLSVFALLLALMLVVAACGDGDETATTVAPTTATTGEAGGGTTASTAPSGEVKTLKIGAIMGLTGPLSVPSLAFMRGFEMYVDVVNEQGGVKIGNDTYTLELIEEDSKGAAEGATTAAQKLVNQDKVDFVIGAMMEAEIAGIYSVTGPAGVLYIQANSNNPAEPPDVSADKPLQIRLCVSPDENQALNLDYILETYPAVKTIAAAVPDVGSEQSVEMLRASAAKRGMEVIHTEIWSWGTTDFIPVYTNIVASKPDVILGMNSGQSPDQLKAARQLGFEGPFISNCPLGADVFVVQVQDPVMLTDIIVNSPDVTNPSETLQALMTRWAAKWPNDPFVSDSFHAYDMPWIVIQAMQKAGSIDSATVAATLESMTNKGDFQTNFGPARMGGMERYGCNRVLYRPYPITRLMNGVAEFVGYIDPVAE